MSEINPSPEDLTRAKEKVCAEIMKADEFVVFVHGDDEEGEPGVQTICSASPQNYGFFSHAFQRAAMVMAHSMLGEMLGVDADGSGDITDSWLGRNDDDGAAPLPDPDTVEVPDCLPADWGTTPAPADNRDWDTPGGEFPKKGDA